ncbi:MAG TPA: WD40 repeat domain-containing protein [Bacteroidales bacterium]|nr:WD40 repeat domain-containing protein [Bacteroidales bacterium]
MKNLISLLLVTLPTLAYNQSLFLPSNDNVIRFIEYSPDGKYVIANSKDNILTIWDMETGQPTHHLPHEQTVYFAEYDATGKYILSSSYMVAGINPVTEGVSLWNTKTGALIHKFKDHNHFIKTMDFQPQSELIITGSKDSTAKIYDIESGKLLHSLNYHNGSVDFVRFSPAGDKVITASSDGTVKLFDLKTEEVIHSLEDHESEVTYAEFSPDGKSLFTASDDKTVKEWNFETGTLIKTLNKHPNDVKYLCFSPDEKYMVTIATDLISRKNSILIWDAATLDLLHEIEGDLFDDNAPGHRKFINAAVISNDSKKLITSSFDKTLKIWNLETGERIKDLNYYAPYLSYHPSENKFLAASLSNFTIFDGKTADEVIQVHIVNDAADKWIHTYDYKYVDTPEEVLNSIALLKDGHQFPFTDHKEEYYVQGLWSKVMESDTTFISSE